MINYPKLFEEAIAFIYWLVKGRRQERNKRIARALMGDDFYYGEPTIWNGIKWIPLDEYYKNGR